MNTDDLNQEKKAQHTFYCPFYDNIKTRYGLNHLKLWCNCRLVVEHVA
jgi:hypothetical protein